MSMSIRAVIFIGLVMRLVWAGYIAYLGVKVGLGPDAQIFYDRMIDVVRTGSFEPIKTGGPLAVNLTAFVMMPFGDVLLIACVLSCAVWWIAARLFVASLELLQLSYRQKLWATLLFTFWPTAIPYTSNPLRESFQLCFVNLAVFGALYLLINRRLASWTLVLAGAFLAGLLHGALAAFGLATLGLTVLFFSLTSGKKFPVVPFLIGSVVAGGIFYFSEQIISSSSYDLSAGTLTTIQSYQEGGVSDGGRAAYTQEVGDLSLLNALVALPIGFFQYLFEPFPQRISTLADFVLALENLLRLIILLSIPASFRKLKDPIARRVLLYLLSLYVAQEFIWSVGTINWGTASRHHVPAMGLAMLVAAHLRIFQPVSQRAPRRPRPLLRRSVRL
jgi:hypothetical protein